MSLRGIGMNLQVKTTSLSRDVIGAASIGALGNRTTYAYDQFGNLVSVIDPLGNAVVYEYDLCGNKTYEGGANYPVRYTYDIFGNKTTMMTYRDEKGERGTGNGERGTGNGERGTGNGERGTGNGERGDVTTWLYDEALGVMTNKVYADGKGPRYDYTPDGKLSQRTWARGIVTDYTYDNWGSLTNTVYSDGTPTRSLSYDALGRQIEAHDAAGVTTFAYDSFGSLTNETVVGVAGTNTIIRYWDDFGRSAGYTLNNVRQSTLAYDLATARLVTMLANGSDAPFTWSYLPGSDLKSSLSYPNGLTATWTYDANGQFLQVKNAFPTNIISQYDYAYDAAGRRVEITRSGAAMSETRTDIYGYNIRNELISASKVGVLPGSTTTEYAYQYDDIGNRLTSLDLGTNCTYVANSLNQYTSISNSALSAPPRETFIPQFDDDGNQTLIKTATGVWSVTYNGENRPVLWSCGATNIVMFFDRMGRRVLYLETCGASTNSNNTSAYDNYLCVARHCDGVCGASATDRFVWDPTEHEATRPLVFYQLTVPLQFYTHDGNKNVSDLTDSSQSLCAHYAYSPFGALFSSFGSSAITNFFRYSSEYVDEDLGLIYYNYRHFNSRIGKWLSRDDVDEIGSTIYKTIKRMHVASAHYNRGNRFTRYSYSSQIASLAVSGRFAAMNKNLYAGPANPLTQYDKLGREIYVVSPGTLPVDIYEKVEMTDEEKFMEWYRANKDLSWIDSLPACPCCLERRNGKFLAPGTGWGRPVHNSLHPGSSVCIRTDTYVGAGEQCCYDKDGRLITRGRGAGTPDKYAPSVFNLFFSLHYASDVWPFSLAKRLDDSKGGVFFLQRYLELRPPQNKNNCPDNGEPL